jgi:hypothetical protein
MLQAPSPSTPEAFAGRELPFTRHIFYERLLMLRDLDYHILHAIFNVSAAPASPEWCLGMAWHAPGKPCSLAPVRMPTQLGQ